MDRKPILSVDTASDTPIYAQIVDQIRRFVISGALKPGDEIPSVRRLAATLEINPNTVSKAYLILEQDRIVLKRARKGCYIAPDASARAARSAESQFDLILDRLDEESVRLGLDPLELLKEVRGRLERRSDHSKNRNERRPDR